MAASPARSRSSSTGLRLTPAARRWRISELRAGADAAARERRALEARLYRRQGTLEKVEEVAERLRISELQRAVDDAERKIGRLKARMGRAGGRRAGWYGVAARTAEVLAAVGTGSGRVALQVAARRTDLLAMLREDTTSLLRMGTNWSLTSSYLTRAEALLPHAPAIYARAAQLERHAVPIQLILDEHFDYLEPVRRATLRRNSAAQFSDPVRHLRSTSTPSSRASTTSSRTCRTSSGTSTRSRRTRGRCSSTSTRYSSTRARPRRTSRSPRSC
jgi:hypothetical protein